MTTTVTCMFHSERHTQKPDDEIKKLVCSLTTQKMPIRTLANELAKGCTFRPAVLTGTRTSDFVSQELFALDFDHDVTIDSILDRCKEKHIEPTFGYTSFNHTEDNHRFRIVFHSDRTITDLDERNKIQSTFETVFPETDLKCNPAAHLFFGGKELLFLNENAFFNPDELIKQFYKPPEAQMPKREHKPEPPDITVKTFQNPNIKAISELDVKTMAELLGLEQNDGEQKKSFDNKGEMYDYINNIDLREYLGIDSNVDMFNCILPDHTDHKPSAHIYRLENGTYVYKCFGCGKTRFITGITEELSGCKHHEAINFIKQVYGIELVESDWVKQHKEQMVESAMYLDTDEFKLSFPDLNSRIRSRKGHIQKMLLYFSQYVSDENQIDGKPYFYSSYDTLMKICDIPKFKREMLSQSLTLFCLAGMIDKVPLDKIPEKDLNKAKAISEAHGFKKLTNFYQFEEYGENLFSGADENAKILKQKNVKLKTLSRESVLRTFGREVADRVYPQYAYNNAQGNSELSDKHTVDIANVILDCICKKGYATENDVMKNLGFEYSYESNKRQFDISLQEILDTYELERIRLNKKLKEKLNIDCKGYPYVIISHKN